ncbi:acyltransferase domain-containing protein [Streptomyces sp. NPDC046685]|uniref:acyltransferase domain-containing protein n=1 Tax=Streptomyces sp. NPDC046685 TaxID=3157202 RepID=UPI0033C8B27C
MDGRVVLLIPGTVPRPSSGVLGELAREFASVGEVLARIDEVAVELGMEKVSPRLVGLSAPPPGTADPDAQYLEIFAVSAAVCAAAAECGLEPFAVAGQSIGELWALAAGGHLTVEDAARIAVARSRALSEQDWPGAMLAVGTREADARSVAALVGDPDLVVACVNAPRQSVLSGPAAAIARAGEIAEFMGWPTAELDVPHASHSPALGPAARLLRAQQPPVAYGGRHWRIWSTNLAREVGDEDPLEMTVDALTSPVRLLDTLRALHGQGVNVFVDCGARPVAGPLAEASLPGIRVHVPLADPAGPAAVLRALASGAATSAPLGPVGSGKSGGKKPKGKAKDKSKDKDKDKGWTKGKVKDSRSAHRSPTGTPVWATAPAPVHETVHPATETVRESPVASAAAVSEPAAYEPAAAEAAVTPAPAAALDRQEIVARLRTLYAEALEYPEEVLEEDADLEASLGIESLQQLALLRRTEELYGVEGLRHHPQLLQLATLGRIADAVIEARAAV